MALKSGNSGSCGCSRFDRKHNSDWVALFSQLNNRARQYQRPCELNLGQFIFISGLPCAYCGVKPSNRYHRTMTVDVDGERKRVFDESSPLLYSGIDRVDSSKGYYPGNVLPCCGFCNRAKDDWTVKEFFERLARLGCQLLEADVRSLAELIGQQLLQVEGCVARGRVSKKASHQPTGRH
jgi:hypothetical protein